MTIKILTLRYKSPKIDCNLSFYSAFLFVMRKEEIFLVFKHLDSSVCIWDLFLFQSTVVNSTEENAFPYESQSG